MLASGIGLYMGMWGSIITNFSKFKVSEDLETARRITDYEGARYGRGDYRLEKIFKEEANRCQTIVVKNAAQIVSNTNVSSKTDYPNITEVASIGSKKDGL